MNSSASETRDLRISTSLDSNNDILVSVQDSSPAFAPEIRKRLLRWQKRYCILLCQLLELMGMTTTRSTIFVVDDDDADIRKALQRSLTRRGYAVESYSSAEEFLAAIEPGRAGCLVLDVRMPGMSGLELQAELSVLDINLPVIFITGHGDIPMSVRVIKKGAQDFLEKPYLVKVSCAY
ncbi:MAG: CheY-like chemotaxis protein [Porticoccaceae bacterium]|jgi:CheY-like chemotaxis protein